MKSDVINLDAGSAGSIELDDAIFAVEPRSDILHRVVRWQLARRQAGTHSTLTRSGTAYSSKKIYRQKGTGRARHGSAGVNLMRHGGTSKGPHPRSHAHDLPKKVRRLGLRMALSAKAKAGELIVLEEAKLDQPKTRALAEKVGKLGWGRALVIDGPALDENFARAARNLEGLQVMPSQGANVYDILKRDLVVVTKAGIEALEARLK